MPKNTLLKFRPIQKFINGIGKKIERYFRKSQGCIIGLGDDGVFYAQGLYEWLKRKGLNLNLVFIDDTGEGLEEDKVKGRKILIVDNDIISGKTYKRAMEIFREKKKMLRIKDIKFAVLCDRTGLADFSVEDYSAFAPLGLNQLDELDLKIIQFLTQDGRKSFIEIAKKTKLSSVSVKNRVGKLIKQGIFKIHGGLCMEKFYSVSAYIGIEANRKTVSELIEKFKKSSLIYHLVKTSGSYNLIINIVAPNVKGIENFISKEIRSNPGVKRIDVNIGELPILPKIWNPPVI